jgi:hypothetical protein
MFAGITDTLISVLDPSTERDEDEKQRTLEMIMELAKDPDNLRFFQVGEQRSLVSRLGPSTSGVVRGPEN